MSSETPHTPYGVKRAKRLVHAGTMSVLALAISSGIADAKTPPKDVEIVILTPLSGAWARDGELEVEGAKAAVSEINAQGGIEALGGAKLKLLVADSGDSVEKARNAAQRVISQNPNLVGGIGAFVSSLTMAVTEVSERAKLPWLTLSYSDQLTNRGYRYVFQTSALASAQSAQALPVIMHLAKTATGQLPTSVGVVMDNTPSPISFVKPMLDGGFRKAGLDLSVKQIYTPPLADATSIAMNLRNRRPNFAFLLTTNIQDTKQILDKMNEMGIGSGRIPLIGDGGEMVAPDLAKAVSKDELNGVMGIVANFPGKGLEQLAATFEKEYKEPWMSQDSLSTYGEVWILKDALEKAGSADREKVAQAIRTMNTTDGPARYFPGGRVQFDAKGRMVGAKFVIVQWQGGKPVPIYPSAIALGKPIWPAGH